MCVRASVRAGPPARPIARTSCVAGSRQGVRRSGGAGCACPGCGVDDESWARRPALTSVCGCARRCRAEALQVEIECRQEEEDVAVDIDWETASQKSMAKVVNQVCACCDAHGALQRPAAYTPCGGLRDDISSRYIVPIFLTMCSPVWSVRRNSKPVVRHAPWPCFSCPAPPASAHLRARWH
jgi:hypothetical protein